MTQVTLRHCDNLNSSVMRHYTPDRPGLECSNEVLRCAQGAIPTLNRSPRDAGPLVDGRPVTHLGWVDGESKPEGNHRMTCILPLVRFISCLP
jgi:hypothetical protein